MEPPVTKLWSYQEGLRLRHLTEIVAKNMCAPEGDQITIPECPLPSKIQQRSAQFGFYFTLQISNGSDLFYISQLQRNLNPNWDDLHFDALDPINLGAMRGILLKIWYRPHVGAIDTVVTSWAVYLNGLAQIGPCLPCVNSLFKANTIIFRLRGVYYTSIENYYPFSTSNCDMPILRFGFLMPMSEIKPGSTVAALSRLHGTKRADRHQNAKGDELRDRLEYLGVTRTSEKTHLATEVELSRLRVAVLREQLELQIDQLRAIKLAADNADNVNQEKGLELLGGYRQLSRQIISVRTLQSGTELDIDNLSQTTLALAEKRCHLLAQLLMIYPISNDTKNGTDRCQICGIHLPNAESYDGTSDLALTAALGYVAQFVLILSNVLSSPLRFPIKVTGLLTSICDTISMGLNDGNREFPLYTRGREREKSQFQYGVFLLNKNIAQMRWYCGLLTPDLRPTLPNLLNLVKLMIAGCHGVTNNTILMPDLVISPRLGSLDPVDVTPPSWDPNGVLGGERHSNTHLDTLNYMDVRLPNERKGQRFWKFKTGRLSPTKVSRSGGGSPASPSLMVREIELSGKEGMGRFVVVDKVIQSLASRDLEGVNGLSVSLDHGLDALSSPHPHEVCANGLRSDWRLAVLRRHSANPNGGGSEPNLLDLSNPRLVQATEDRTTALLRSWKGKAMSASECQLNTSECHLEEGEECDESFMCGGRRQSQAMMIGTFPSQELGIERLGLMIDNFSLGNGSSGLEIDTVVPLNKDWESQSDSASSASPVVVPHNLNVSDSTTSLERNDISMEAKEITNDKGTENFSLENCTEITNVNFPSEVSTFELPSGDDKKIFAPNHEEEEEKTFLDEVAFRTAALASNKFSFKMTFARQPTEKESD